MKLLFRSENLISGITKTRYDIAVLVESFINTAAIEMYIGMILGNAFDSFGRGNDGHELDVLAALLLDEIERRRTRTARMATCPTTW